MLKIGHRGAAGHEPENTIRSFQRALDMGVDCVEFDVRMTKDGQLAVLHDETLDRTAGVAGFLRNKTLAEVKQLDFGKKEQILTLSEALAFLKGRTHVIVELKEMNCALQLLKIFQDFAPWREEDLIIIAFDEDDPIEGGHSSWQDLIFLKATYPALATGFLFTPQKLLSGHTPESICKMALKARARFVAPCRQMVTHDLVNLVHRHGLEIFTWVVNDPNDILRLKSYEIDGIASDFPDRLR